MNFFLPRSLEDYRPFIALEPYEAVKVSGTEVAWADYEALARDFPFLAGLPGLQVDQWIVDHFSYISKYQIELGELRNMKIPTTGETTTVYRQANYAPEFLEFQGRGDIVVVNDPRTGRPAGLVDRKGVGVSRRKFQENFEILRQFEKEGNAKGIETRNLSNGLMYLGEAMIEAAALKVTQRVFDILNFRREFDQPFPDLPIFRQAPLQTIEGYFVLKFPFDLLAGDNPALPAAIYARQAHVGRVWAGKIYTDKVNIKQADFFFALCDGGTVRVRLPELKENAKKIAGGPDLLHYQMGRDLIDRFLAGEKKVLAKTIEEVLAPVEKELAEVDAARPASAPVTNGPEAFAALLDVILADPIRFSRFGECIWYVMKHDPALVKKHEEKIRKLVRIYLATPHSVKDLDDSGKPLRRWGFLLHAVLPAEERKKILARSFWDIATEPEFLARAALLYPAGEIRPYRRKIYRRASGWLRIHLREMVADPRLANHPRIEDWRELHDWVMPRKERRLAIALDTQAWVTRANIFAWVWPF